MNSISDLQLICALRSCYFVHNLTLLLQKLIKLGGLCVHQNTPTQEIPQSQLKLKHVSSH
jgi:hypothetical protein